MFQALLHSHSGLRWVVLILLVAAVVNSLMKKNSTEFTKSDKMISLMSMAFTHIQILLGAALFFMSQKVSFHDGFMKESATRFFAVEHTSMMIIAVVLLTIGYSKAKRQDDAAKKHKTILIFYGIGLLLILAGIPWPFRAALGAGWF